MDSLVTGYWKELAALISFVAYTIRQEMITRANVAKIKSLEKQLSSEKVNEWVAFKATTEFHLAEHDKQFIELFRFHNEGKK